MKKIFLSIIYFVVALGSLVLVQSCEKEKGGPTMFYATIQQYQGDKVHINGNYSYWDVEDSIKMHTWFGTIGRQGNSNYINFGNVQILQNGTDYQVNTHEVYKNDAFAAIYPHTLVREAFELKDDNGRPAVNPVFLEPTQLYHEDGNHHQLLQAPMVAYLPAADGYVLPGVTQHYRAADTVLRPRMEFKNVCALLKVTVNTDVPITVTRIEVENTGGRPLWGDFEITFDDNNWQPILRERTGTDYAGMYVTKEVTLECEHHGEYGGVSIAANSSHSFHIYLPPVGYANMQVTVYAKETASNPVVEKCMTLVMTAQPGTFEANTIYPLTINHTTSNSSSWISLARTHDLGPFTVNASGKQVEFSKSNLHWDNDNSHSDGGFFFSPYQYDFIGFHNEDEDHDHFSQTQRNTVLSSFDRTNNWTLLSTEEWEYLLGPLTDAGVMNFEGVGCRSATNRFVCAVVASVPGLILFPDDFTLTTISFTNINKFQSNFGNNIISIPQFYELEHVGCVFIPCVNYSDYTAANPSEDVATLSLAGNYWGPASWQEVFKMPDMTSGASPALIRLVKVITNN